MSKNLFAAWWEKARLLNPSLFSRFSWLGLSLFLALAITCGLLAWYYAKPQTTGITAQITPPKITPNDVELEPDSLNIHFGIMVDGALNPKSVAPLSMIGKEVSTGVHIDPFIKGYWSWESDNHLVFLPETDWLAGKQYRISFDKTFFASNSDIKIRQYQFTTLPFEAQIANFRFYQDPINVEQRKAVATIHFNYPVNTASFENHIRLQWEALKNQSKEIPIKYTIQYDEHKRIAYLHSDTLPLPSNERYLTLTLMPGIKALEGSSETLQTETAKTLVPDASRYFNVTQINSIIVRNQKDQPEQMLNVETSLGVSQAEIDTHLQVYLLPNDYPATALEEAKPNYQWSNPGEVTPSILAKATKLTLKALPAERDYATLHSYQYQAATPGYLYVVITKGAKSDGNFQLTNSYQTILAIPAYPQEITFLHKGALLALGSEQKLSVLVRGLNAVKFDFARVLPQNINHLITQTEGNFSNPYFINYQFNQNNISEISTDIKTFDASNPAKQQYTALDLSQYLHNKTHPLGLFLLQARAWDKEKNYPLEAQNNRLILITDLGLIAKDNANGTHDMFVQSITRGTPVANANVSVLGKNGLPIYTHLTDAQGHAALPSFNDFINEREPVVYLVKHGNDVSFMPYKRSDRLLNYSRFDIGGIAFDTQRETALMAFMFSDRGIYRPGDTAHLGLIIKQPYALPQPPGLPLELIITDSRGNTVKDEKFTLNDSGFITTDLITTATATTGQYQASLYIIKDQHPSNLIGSTTLTVAEFQPDRMRINTSLNVQHQTGWISPQGVKAKVSLWNLYGAPAVNRRVAGKAILAPQSIKFAAYPQFIFFDPLFNPKSPPKVLTEDLKETQTDTEGLAELPLNLERFEKATYELTVFTEGFEAEGGRSVSAQTKALISPLHYLVGYKSDGNLQYIKQNEAREVRLIAVNPELKQQALSNLTLQIFKQHPVTSLVKKEDGTYQYQSILQTTLLKETPLALSETGINYVLPTTEIGDFLVAIVDNQRSKLSQFKYSVVGASSTNLTRDAELSLKLNKSEFNPGEEIELQIMAPYTGAGLITLERDTVKAFQWFKTNTTASVQKIRIPDDFQGNGYVNVTFVRDFNSPDIFISPLSYSLLPFSVSHRAQEIKVDLNTTALARPGDTLNITYQTDKPAKIIIFAVDEGILQVSQYRTPDPLAFFFQKQALSVETSQIVDQILPKFIAARELSSVGGDGGESALSKNLNPFKRKTEAPVVFWSGLVDSDAMPRSLSYIIPDYFNGSLRVMAVAASSDAVGSAEKTTEVKGHFVISPNVPTFIAPGDEFEVTASIANNILASGADAPIEITLNTSSALSVKSALKQTLIIPEGQDKSIRFTLKANTELGSANLEFKANLKDKTSQLTATTSVRPATPYLTTILSGHATQTQTIKLDRQLYPAYRKVEAFASPNPFILVNGLSHYLSEFPYGCTEQLVSKAFPLLAMQNQMVFSANTPEINEKIKQTIQAISQRQISSGGFNYWPEGGNPESNQFASVYAMHFFTLAKSQGHAVANDTFSNGISYLKELAMQEVTDLNKARIQAYAIYILTLNELITTNYLVHLQSGLEHLSKVNWHQDITSVYIASVYQLLQNAKEAEHLITYFKPNHFSENNISDFYNADIANAQYFYLINKHFPERATTLSNLIDGMVQAINNETLSTLLSSDIILALASYKQSYDNTVNTSLAIKTKDAQEKSIGISTAKGLFQEATIPINATQLIFENTGKEPYFYQIVQSGFDKVIPNAFNKGIEVYKELMDVNKNEVTQASLGQEITVRIRTRAIDNEYHSNIAIVDLLPGGFEVVRESVQLQSFDYVDIREDRVIFFGSITPDTQEVTYRIKATNIGQFTVPPILGTAMYQPSIKSLGTQSHIQINKD